MTKRIKELAEQAKNDMPKGKLDVGEWIELYNQKFAELIIKESVTAMENTLSNYDVRALFHPSEMIHIMYMIIKKQFGIEYEDSSM
jgi:hypothetical protein